MIQNQRTHFVSQKENQKFHSKTIFFLVFETYSKLINIF